MNTPHCNREALAAHATHTDSPTQWKLLCNRTSCVGRRQPHARFLRVTTRNPSYSLAMLQTASGSLHLCVESCLPLPDTQILVSAIYATVSASTVGCFQLWKSGAFQGQTQQHVLVWLVIIQSETSVQGWPAGRCRYVMWAARRGSLRQMSGACMRARGEKRKGRTLARILANHMSCLQ